MDQEMLQQGEIGKVLALTGQVSAEYGGTSRTLQTGDPVYEGEIIKASAGSNAQFQFRDDTLLSVGDNSSITLDKFVYDPTHNDLSFRMMEGTFKIVTGKIADNHPEHFQLKSPLATIGIRGTTTLSVIGPDGEKHGAELVHPGHALTIQDGAGEMRLVTESGTLVDFHSDGTMGFPRALSLTEMQMFQTVTPITVQPTPYTSPAPKPDPAHQPPSTPQSDGHEAPPDASESVSTSAPSHQDESSAGRLSLTSTGTGLTISGTSDTAIATLSGVGSPGGQNLGSLAGQSSSPGQAASQAQTDGGPFGFLMGLAMPHLDFPTTELPPELTGPNAAPLSLLAIITGTGSSSSAVAVTPTPTNTVQAVGDMTITFTPGTAETVYGTPDGGHTLTISGTAESGDTYHYNASTGLGDDTIKLAAAANTFTVEGGSHCATVVLPSTTTDQTLTFLGCGTQTVDLAGPTNSATSIHIEVQDSSTSLNTLHGLAIGSGTSNDHSNIGLGSHVDVEFLTANKQNALYLGNQGYAVNVANAQTITSGDGGNLIYAYTTPDHPDDSLVTVSLGGSNNYFESAAFGEGEGNQFFIHATSLDLGGGTATLVVNKTTHQATDHPEYVQWVDVTFHSSLTVDVCNAGNVYLFANNGQLGTNYGAYIISHFSSGFTYIGPLYHVDTATQISIKTDGAIDFDYRADDNGASYTLELLTSSGITGIVCMGPYGNNSLILSDGLMSLNLSGVDMVNLGTGTAGTKTLDVSDHGLLLKGTSSDTVNVEMSSSYSGDTLTLGDGSMTLNLSGVDTVDLGTSSGTKTLAVSDHALLLKGTPSSAVTVEMSPSYSGDTLTLGDGSMSLNLSGVDTVDLASSSGRKTINTSDHSLHLNAGTDTNVNVSMSSSSSADTLTLSGAYGSANLSGVGILDLESTHALMINNNSGNLTVKGNDSDAQLDMWGSDNTLTLGDGNLYLDIFRGMSVLDLGGATGSKHISYGGGSNALTVTGSSASTLELNIYPSNSTITLGDGTMSLDLNSNVSAVNLGSGTTGAKTLGVAAHALSLSGTSSSLVDLDMSSSVTMDTLSLGNGSMTLSLSGVDTVDLGSGTAGIKTLGISDHALLIKGSASGTISLDMSSTITTDTLTLGDGDMSLSLSGVDAVDMGASTGTKTINTSDHSLHLNASPSAVVNVSMSSSSSTDTLALSGTDGNVNIYGVDTLNFDSSSGVSIYVAAQNLTVKGATGSSTLDMLHADSTLALGDGDLTLEVTGSMTVLDLGGGTGTKNIEDSCSNALTVRGSSASTLDLDMYDANSTITLGDGTMSLDLNGNVSTVKLGTSTGVKTLGVAAHALSLSGTSSSLVDLDMSSTVTTDTLTLGNGDVTLSLSGVDTVDLGTSTGAKSITTADSLLKLTGNPASPLTLNMTGGSSDEVLVSSSGLSLNQTGVDIIAFNTAQDNAVTIDGGDVTILFDGTHSQNVTDSGSGTLTLDILDGAIPAGTSFTVHLTDSDTSLAHLHLVHLGDGTANDLGNHGGGLPFHIDFETGAHNGDLYLGSQGYDVEVSNAHGIFGGGVGGTDVITDQTTSGHHDDYLTTVALNNGGTHTIDTGEWMQDSVGGIGGHSHADLGQNGTYLFEISYHQANDQLSATQYLDVVKEIGTTMDFTGSGNAHVDGYDGSFTGSAAFHITYDHAATSLTLTEDGTTTTAGIDDLTLKANGTFHIDIATSTHTSDHLHLQTDTGLTGDISMSASSSNDILSLGSGHFEITSHNVETIDFGSGLSGTKSLTTDDASVHLSGHSSDLFQIDMTCINTTTNLYMDSASQNVSTTGADVFHISGGNDTLAISDSSSHVIGIESANNTVNLTGATGSNLIYYQSESDLTDAANANHIKSWTDGSDGFKFDSAFGYSEASWGADWASHWTCASIISSVDQNGTDHNFVYLDQNTHGTLYYDQTGHCIGLSADAKVVAVIDSATNNAHVQCTDIHFTS